MKPSDRKYTIPKAARWECRKRRANRHSKQKAQYRQQERELRQEMQS